MTIKALGYLGFHANSIEDWNRYGAQFLGLQLAEQSAGTLAFRMDDRKQRLLIHGDTDRRPILGWELEDAAAADQLAARLERAEVRVDIMDKSMAGQRRVAGGLTFQDPGGNKLEAFHGPEIATDPYRPGRSHSGFKTGPLGLGHIVLNTTEMDADVAFYTQLLGFKLSDYMTKPFRAMFLYLSQKCRYFAGLAAPCYSDPPLSSVFRAGRGMHCKARQPSWQALAASLCRWADLLRSAAMDRCGNPWP